LLLPDNPNIKSFIKKANAFGKSAEPFFFLLDFEMQKPFICRLKDCHTNRVYFDIRGKKNISYPGITAAVERLKPEPVGFEVYNDAFENVLHHLKIGDTYLLNLTFPSQLGGDLDLEALFYSAAAKYKLFFRDEFTLFSPESFIRAENNCIFTYPMKGTIDASLPDAEKQLLANDKEHWEHNTIVDLMRNDLSMVSSNVRVRRFRYIEHIKTSHKNLLQMSSEIQGELPGNWREDVGRILCTLLPAGSISGAPKKRTLEIIAASEKIPRGYFTGVFGVFDGQNIDSAVNIRFIEYRDGQYYYRSGGGLTALSKAREEYEEMINKVYVPFA
jgi:para-aminobenzoate synthetase component 1